MKKNFAVLALVLSISFVFIGVIIANAQENQNVKKILTDKEKEKELKFLNDDIRGIHRKFLLQLIHPLQDESGEFVGAGLEFFFNIETKAYFVGGTMKNSPAEKAGFQKDDALIAVNGKIDLSTDDFIKEVKGDGKAGRLVVFDVIRGGEKMQISIVTAVLRSDKTAEANKLLEVIYKDFPTLSSKLELAAYAIKQALAAPSITWDNPVFDEYEKVFKEIRNWLDIKEKEVTDLLKLE